MKKHLGTICMLIFMAFISTAFAQQPKSEKLTKIEQALKDDVPKILCVNEAFATAAQPNDAAFAKLAADGFHAVLNLRTANEGVDLKHEQELVEKAGMKYFNVPVTSTAPSAENVEAFMKVVKDKANHPLLIHCASANRAGAFWMIYRVLDDKWPEDKALEEAKQVGLTSPVLTKFAQDYIAAHR
ncbi:MAG: protein tyrosine phosphatase family protein [Acidobacteria bacterium]|nr:protein tyrosine phosphatase family protein [Acidobacteriota bacterium]